MTIEVKDENSMINLGITLGSYLSGGEAIELVGDVGSGKTTFTKGIAIGLGVKEIIQSPSFTISRQYSGRDGIILVHYDFYRLKDAGVMTEDIKEVISDDKTVTVIEWSEAVKDILPDDRLSIGINVLADESRKLFFSSGGEISSELIGRMKDDFAVR
ncbi:MAG: tRNA (adenosine(37)-N6)-threonylcarbamoyltransferase complex ATPase subunit type 1 TsaE [Candidatus Saccharimonadaceae bacterium]|nr:tRNA (adenosine(37)-N6)-threonylcarbamoyltransferase complex ATPase subunit type 1 TsaE [Candidatus Saccharimonadaceae bacterium]